MLSCKSVCLEEMVWPEVESALENGTRTAIVAVASIEQHGPHLPLSMDTLDGDELSARIAAELGDALAAATILIAEGVFGGGVVALSVVVGAFMLLANLHEYVPLLSFTPGGFFGYATLFSVNAAGTAAFGASGLAGETVVVIGAMSVGALISYATDVLSGMIH